MARRQLAGRKVIRKHEHEFDWGSFSIRYRVYGGRIRACTIMTSCDDLIPTLVLQERLSDVVALGSTMAHVVNETIADSLIRDELVAWLKNEITL
ncbi:hypothetical protein SANA_03250 [Gottschalkiaceae bacterium SANA]|nr:hypothetical protein SANA_03250 [Gottschalkiaceae bacterium SANA]